MYIRTKDGRILDFDKLNEVSKLSIDMAEEPIREAKTIEELCDRYIGISNNKPMIIKYEFDEYYDEYGDSYTKEELLMEYDIIYGAIYTSKGLIYVAKMNDKGELDLI